MIKAVIKTLVLVAILFVMLYVGMTNTHTIDFRFPVAGFTDKAPVRTAAAQMAVPYSEIEVAQFDDPYQVPRVLKALLDAPIAVGAAPRIGWVERVMKTKLLSVSH